MRELEVSVCLGVSAFTEGVLAPVQELLLKHAPRWASGAHRWMARKPKRWCDLTVPDSLRKEVYAELSDRCPLYHQLVERYGRGPYERVCGVSEMRGSRNGLVALIGADEMVFAPLSGGWRCGNHFDVVVTGTKFEGKPTSAWCKEFLLDCCRQLSPWYAYVGAVDEINQKNRSQEGGGMRPVGWDISRHLPGVYWLNYFGGPYPALIGKSRLASAPAPFVAPVGEGVVVGLGDDPHAWNTPDYRAVEQQVRSHLGRQFFFDRNHPDRDTVGPDLGLAR